MSSLTEKDEVKTCPTKKITWRIENYSKVKQNTLFSTPVMLEGYKWQMSLYPSKKADGYLSLFLGVEEPTAPADGWFVKANYVFKLIDQLHPNEFFSKQDCGKCRTFNSTRPYFGDTSFMSIDLLQNKEKGYLLNDTCVIEIELTVTAASAAQEDYLLHLETMSSFMENVEVKTCPTKKMTWRIKNYSKVKQNRLFSTPVMIEGYKWQMSLYPSKKADGYLSLFLGVVEPTAPADGWFVKANYVFKLIDQLHPNEFFSKGDSGICTFNSTRLCLGYTSFTSIDFLQNKEKGYLLNDTCVIEIELTVTAASAVPEVVSCINQQPLICTAQEDYLLHLETMDAIHAKALSFLKSSSADEDHVDKSAVKLLKDAVKVEEGIITQISTLRNRHAQEKEAATKEAKELIGQSLDSATDGILDARCALTLASLCEDLDECVNIHKGAAFKDASGGIDRKLDALRKRSKDKSEVARKQLEALTGQRVEASKRTQQLYVTITNEKVIERSKSKSTWWRKLISLFKR